MRRSLYPPLLLLFLLAIPTTRGADEDKWITLSGPDGLKAWKGPTDDWMLAASVELDPKNPMKLADAAARTEVEEFLGEIDEDDDVQHIYVGLEA